MLLSEQQSFGLNGHRIWLLVATLKSWQRFDSKVRPDPISKATRSVHVYLAPPGVSPGYDPQPVAWVSGLARVIGPLIPVGQTTD